LNWQSAKASETAIEETIRAGDHRGLATCFRATKRIEPDSVVKVTFWSGRFNLKTAPLPAPAVPLRFALIHACFARSMRATTKLLPYQRSKVEQIAGLRAFEDWVHRDREGHGSRGQRLGVF
jgi:hypothetical protein